MARKPDRNEKGHFLPGSGGRPQGVRNKLQHDFLTALQADFEKEGKAVVKIVRLERPAEYLKILAGVLPKEIDISDNRLKEYPDEALDAFIELAKDHLASRTGGAGSRKGETTH